MKFTFVAVSVPALLQVQAFKENYDRKYPNGDLEIRCFYIAGFRQEPIEDPQVLIEAIGDADAAVIDTMGASEALQEVVRKGLELCRGQRLVIGNTLREYLRLGAFSMASMGKMMKKPQQNNEAKKQEESAVSRMNRIRRMALMAGRVLPFGMTKDMKNAFALIDYWQQATPKDIASFMHLILRQYGGQKFLPKEEACTMQYGIYLKHPVTEVCTESIEKYWKKEGFDHAKDTVALLFYGHSYPNDFLPVVRAIAERLKEQYNILPIAFSQNEDSDLDKLESILCQTTTPVSAVINLMPFRLGAGPMGGDARRAVSILTKLNVPYLKPFCLTKVSDEEWADAGAVNPGEFLISILLPELDGGIMSVPVGVMASKGGRLPELVPIEDRIDMLVKRLTKLIALRRKKNSEKKVALIFYNYPPGESNVFGGAFLDTFASAAELLKALKKEGYQVEEMTAEDLKNAFLNGGRCNCPEWSDEEWETDDGALSWEMDGTIYPVKGILNGNAFIGLQPVREDNEDLSEDIGQAKKDGAFSNYHDRNKRPLKAYQAFYEWINKGFQADAMVHFGTHGTLEFLPGKDNGMTGDCWPDRLVDEVPHFYYYYIGNPSEAMIAKRRSLATLIGYQAPPLKKSGLYGVYQELKETIAEYRESQQSAPERCDDLMTQIEKMAVACQFLAGYSAAENKNAHKDLPIPENLAVHSKIDNTVTEKMLDILEDKLYTYENSLITDGLHLINRDETTGLVRALNGEYIPVGNAGDVIKNPDILPSGRNLVQFDPRLVPTKTACERGEKAARLAVEKYYQQTGKYPDTTAVILWGLETSRSQGETIGQILYYLGLRLKTEKGSYDDRLEIIPTEELGRPRMDVVIHICGFFRDMYPNLIDNLNEMMQRLLTLHESDDENYYARNTRKITEDIVCQALKEGRQMDEKTAQERASCRIFGPKAGEYGTRLTEIVRKGEWKEAENLGSSFVEDLSYGYGYHTKGTNSKELLACQYQHVDFVTQVRNNVEYELTDLDHYYEFYGGLSKAVEKYKGEKPVMLVADTTGETVDVQRIDEALNRGIAARILNPKWIEGMMRHEYHGVQQINKRFENVMGFAATTDAVDSEIFSRMTQCYAADETLRHRMQKSNRWAYMKMMERLMEANNRGYYQATDEELMQIREAYLEAEGEAEE